MSSKICKNLDRNFEVIEVNEDNRSSKNTLVVGLDCCKNSEKNRNKIGKGMNCNDTEILSDSLSKS